MLQQPQAGEAKRPGTRSSAPLLSHAENSTRHAALTWRVLTLPVSGRCELALSAADARSLYTFLCSARLLLFPSPFCSCLSLQESLIIADREHLSTRLATTTPLTARTRRQRAL
jgi:hypothetical protein